MEKVEEKENGIQEKIAQEMQQTKQTKLQTISSSTYINIHQN